MKLKSILLIAILLMVLYFVISHSFFFASLGTILGAVAILVLVLLFWSKLK